MIYDVIIVGGGPAGLFAAANLDSKYKTLLLEGNKKVGSKLLMTGAGQCNLTNAENIKTFPGKYNNPGFVRKILYEFNNLMLMEYFEDKGLKLVVRDDNKVFPYDLKASSVVELFIEEIEKRNHEILLNEKVIEIKFVEKLGIFNIGTENNKYSTKKLILAGGGKSYPISGSDGSLIEIVGRLGVVINTLKPALTSVKVENYKFQELSGISLKDVRLTIIRNGKTKINKRGDLLFTHRDISGPLILNNSRYMNIGNELIVDFLADKSVEELEMDIWKAARNAPKKIVKTILENCIDLPKRMVENIMDVSKINYMKKISETSKKEIRIFILNCKEYKFIIKSFGGFESAMVTNGGVDVNEIDSTDMSWKDNRNLHFIGELIDIDGETGGYNLQFAFSTAKKTIISL